MDTKYLIVNADDFGLNSGINRAIIETHQQGIVTSTSLMVNCPNTKEAAELAKQNPALGIGLHFNLTKGKPISGNINSLTDQSGFFLGRTQFEMKMLAGKIKSQDIIQELNLQWDIFQSLGLACTHLDSHQHIHINLQIFKIISAFAREKDIPVRIPNERMFIRWQHWPSFFSPWNLYKLLRKIYLHLQVGKIKKLAKKQSIKINQFFFSIFGCWPFSKNIELDFYKNIIKHVPPGFSELMCHPAHYEQADYYSTTITHLSQQEVLLLQEPALKKIIKECNIQLIHYGNLKELVNG